MKFFFLNAMAYAQEATEQAMDDVTSHVAETAAHHAVTVPTWQVFVQSVNFFFLFAVLFLLLRKAVKHHFASRAETYRELVDRAENARKEAEKTHSEMKERLAKLEASAAQSVAQAKAEAEQLRAKLIEEAKTLAKKMEQEAQRTAALELEKAKTFLRRELLGKAIVATEEKFKKSLGSVEQKKLQNEFAEKIEVVGG